MEKARDRSKCALSASLQEVKRFEGFEARRERRQVIVRRGEISVRNRPAPAQAAVTRERLGRAAMTLLLERGFETTTIDDIAAAADVSRRGFFHYFASRCRGSSATIPHYWRATSSNTKRSSARCR
ncbi:TetR/AcrR family transcriptional regulator [Bradyrhizobium liaoningense]